MKINLDTGTDYTLARDSRESQLKKRSVACGFDFLSLSLMLLIKK